MDGAKAMIELILGRFCCDCEDENE